MTNTNQGPMANAMPSDYHRTTRHLTGSEFHRLLHRYDLAPETREWIETEEWRDADENWSIYGEQLAERGSARHPEPSRLERYLTANPEHTCAPEPLCFSGCGARVARHGVTCQACEDEVPF